MLGKAGGCLEQENIKSSSDGFIVKMASRDCFSFLLIATVPEQGTGPLGSEGKIEV